MNSAIPEIEPRKEDKDSKSEGIKNYDSDNCYPQNIEDIVRASGTATSCTNLYSEFIFGQGFNDLTFYKAKINDEGLTIDELLKHVTLNYATLKGFAIHVNYNALLKISDAKYVPFSYCRLGIEKNKGKIAVYDDWSCTKNNKIEKEKIKFFDSFNDNQDVLKSQIGEDITTYAGQIFWFSANGKDYPLAPCDPVLEDVVSDSSIKRFRLRNIRKGFNASTVIEYGYAFEDDDEKQAEANNWGKFMGPDGSDVIVLENANGNSDEKSIKISKLDVTNNDKMYEVTNTTVKNSIIQNFRQPKRLLAMSEDKGFNAVDVNDDFLFYNAITAKERITIEECFTKIFKNFATPINPSGDYSIKALEFNPVVTEEESLLNTLKPENVKDLISIISSTTLLPEQKVAMIKLIFGVSSEKAQSMVTGLPILQR